MTRIERAGEGAHRTDGGIQIERAGGGTHRARGGIQIERAGNQMDTAESIRREMTVDADAATVFAFFTDPERLIRWIGVSAELEPQPGGASSATKRTADAGFDAAASPLVIPALP
jgi:activator of HSP90 ATPase